MRPVSRGNSRRATWEGLNSDLYAEGRKHSLSLRKGPFVGRAGHSRNPASEPSAGSAGAGEGAAVRSRSGCDRVRTPRTRQSHVPLLFSFCRVLAMHVWRGSASLLSSHGRGIRPQEALKNDSQGLSPVAAGNPGFSRLVLVTSGSLTWCL